METALKLLATGIVAMGLFKIIANAAWDNENESVGDFFAALAGLSGLLAIASGLVVIWKL